MRTSEAGEEQKPKLAPMETFHDVLVGPPMNRRSPGVLWPEFENQRHARLWQRGRAVCQRPEIDPNGAQIIDEPAVFVSMYDNHFGHMVSETVPRIPQSLAEFPDLPLYFTCRQPMSMKHASGMFRSVIDWLNIPHDQIRFLHSPTRFRELHIAPQAETLDGPLGSPDYYDLLEDRIRDNLPDVTPIGVTYVARTLMPPQQGQSAGEKHLVACLQKLGVRVIWPEKLPLHEQMRIYAQTKHLVFAEGSAIHGRQLLGRVDHHVSILRRRFRSHVAQNQLAPRCASLSYVATFKGALNFIGHEGLMVDHAMCSQYRLGPLFEHFEGLGVPLKRVWDQRAFEAQRDEDVLNWVRRIYRPNNEFWLVPKNSPDDLLDRFEELELRHLRDHAAQIIHSQMGPEKGMSRAYRLAMPSVSTGAAARENIADVMCIGCQKGSTSWLHSVLNCHVQTSAFPDNDPVTSTDKEAQFWNKNHERGLDWYRGLMRPERPDLLTMDFTPEYAILNEDKIAACKAVNPSAKVLYILRDPLPRAISALRMMMHWAYGQADDRVHDLDEALHRLLKAVEYLPHGDYLRNLRLWQRYYPDMTVLNYEDFHKDRGGSLEGVFKLLGLHPDDLIPEQKETFHNLRAGAKVWESERFLLSPTIIHFLHGATWQQQDAARTELGMQFEEGARLLSTL